MTTDETTSGADEAVRYMALVDIVDAAGAGQFSRLGAGIIAGVLLGVANDSRSFARLLDVAHALVLREVNVMASDDGLLQVTRRDARTQRSFYELSAAGQRFAALIDVDGGA